MNFVPFRILVFLYGSAALIFRLYCRFSNWSDQLFLQPVDDILFFDFIVVGGGSAGAVVAARLAEDKGHSVLLLEAGGPPRDVFNTPSVAPLLQKTDYDWQYVTEPQNSSCLALENRASIWPRGKILGGCSRLNFMMYVRGDPKDFDSWSDQGNLGWSYDEILPYFRKSETFKKSKNSFRGSNGPFHIEFLKWTSDLVNIFLEGGKALGYSTGDLNAELTEGFSITQVHGLKGQRLSTDTAFLAKHSTNLKVLTYALVEKILLKNSKAFGVQFNVLGQRKFAFAAKEVILSAGAINSPQLLMLSGIGPDEHLQHMKINVVRDLAGVGSNLQDHLTTGANNVILEGKSSGMGLTLRDMLSPSSIWQYFSSKTGPISSNGCEAYALVYSSDIINRTTNPPDIQLLFFPTGHSFEAGKVIKGMTGVTDKIWEEYFSIYEEKTVASIFAVLLRPKSRGLIRLKSANPNDAPLIDPQYLTHKEDIETLVRGMHFLHKLITSEPFESNGALFNEMPLPGCEHFKFGSDPYWECYVRHLSGTVYHPCGTCKMGPSSDSAAVVDSKLRVHGIRGLRVIDASVMPTIVGANINTATIMIAEKGVQMVRDYWTNYAVSSTWADIFFPDKRCF
ncbi:glucose dehydrogenase [FAD, quinone]-like [Neocloeon triangulifer]|uniref:glucose dehydrogenase [FAD, quinone]-like n=1 Tax=Neocloeon triangulifer TaxID=2078957 RepID=UPI00286F2B7F|nr:glucose dehydrogenase [FAD, quinone]-like [Neocloeon triangulifer]XP_059475227.1 glucose dehydrogenase [FAD, quinone]-like [Neocloeon triangulifer]